MAAPHDGNSARVSTGIVGLDEILYGGLLRNRVYLVHGQPGTGKTTLALQYLMECRKRGERTLYITLSETAEELESMAESHGWTLEGIDMCDLSAAEESLKADAQYTVFHPSDVELGETTSAILAEIERVKPAHVVFDGISEVRLLARDPLRYRRQMLALKQYFAHKQITVLLLDDHATPLGDIQPESVVSGVIVLEKNAPAYGIARRRLIINKARATDFRGGYHDYDLVKGGMRVFPRLVAAEHHSGTTPEPLRSGIEGLDTMLKGGLDAGTVTLLLGPAGAGKSTVALQYVAAALAQGKKAAVYTFDEVLDTLFYRAEKLLGGLQQYEGTGLLHVAQVDPAELTPGAFAYEVCKSVEERGADVVVIDSLNGYMNAMLDAKFLETHLHELFAYLNQLKVVTIVTMAQHGLIGRMDSTTDVSYLSDTVVLLRYFEVSGEVRQAISVFKKRRGPHERTLRELRIEEDGLYIGEPLKQFHGIMTGVPQYNGSSSGSGETK
jgi:circadian clock protein KaiC